KSKRRFRRHLSAVAGVAGGEVDAAETQVKGGWHSRGPPGDRAPTKCDQFAAATPLTRSRSSAGNSINIGGSVWEAKLNSMRYRCRPLTPIGPRSSLTSPETVLVPKLNRTWSPFRNLSSLTIFPPLRHQGEAPRSVVK